MEYMNNYNRDIMYFPDSDCPMEYEEEGMSFRWKCEPPLLVDTCDSLVVMQLHYYNTLLMIVPN